MKRFIKHKFNSKPTEFNGERFDSKLEARYARNLEIAKRTGDLLFYLRQVPMRLPGKTVYRVDFVEFWKNGHVLFTDCKGMETEVFKLKKRQVEELYPIQLNIVTKVQ